MTTRHSTTGTVISSQVLYRSREILVRDEEGRTWAAAPTLASKVHADVGDVVRVTAATVREADYTGRGLVYSLEGRVRVTILDQASTLDPWVISREVAVRARQNGATEEEAERAAKDWLEANGHAPDTQEEEAERAAHCAYCGLSELPLDEDGYCRRCRTTPEPFVPAVDGYKPDPQEEEAWHLLALRVREAQAKDAAQALLEACPELAELVKAYTEAPREKKTRGRRAAIGGRLLGVLGVPGHPLV